VTTDASDVQREARALGDPTRYRLFRYIADAKEPVSVAELTAYAGLNHNAIRQHLAVLKSADLVSEEVETRTRPGRPSLLYRLHPEAAGKWETIGSYAWLAGLLAEAIRKKLSVREVGRLEGRRRALVEREGGDATAVMEFELVRNGFRPERRDKDATTDFVLGRCPFEEVAARFPAEVCQLHHGLAEGLAESIGDLSVERLVKKNPHVAGCRLVVTRPHDAD